MKRFIGLFKGFFLVIATLLASSLPGQACAVCMGADPVTGEAINSAIFLMLGFLGLMFAGIGAVSFSIYRRRHTPLPLHSPFATTAAGGVH